MDVQTSDACPHCQVGVALAATVCPHCRHDVLFDLVINNAGVTDPRRRYLVAREVASLGMLAFSEVTAALSIAGGVICHGLPRSRTRPIATLLETHGVQAREQLAPHSPGVTRDVGGRVRSPRIVVLCAALACAAIGGGAVVAFLKVDDASPHAANAAASVASISPSSQAIAETALTSTVALRCGDSVGSGFFVADHVVLTNAHVLCKENSIDVVFRDGSVAKGLAHRRDEHLDLATIRVASRSAPPLPLGDAGALVVRDGVIVVGSPLGLEATVTEGGISNVERHAFGIAYLQTDAAINPGNSGGPMLDRRGTVIGVVTLKHTGAEGVSLAIPINYAYRGPSPLVTRAIEAASADFDARAARAKADGVEAERSLALNMGRPALTAVVVEPGARSIMASVVWLARHSQPSGSVRFRIEVADRADCDVQGRIVDVVELPPDGPQARLFGGSPSTHVDPSTKAYAASVVADITACALGGPTRGRVVLVGGFDKFNEQAF